MSVLYLIPTPISENSLQSVIPQNVFDEVKKIKQFIVEDLRTARRFLSKIGHTAGIDNMNFRIVNEHTKEQEIAPLLPYLLENDTGLLSEAGAPSVADPGAKIVKLAHDNGIKVIPLSGPSSILMAIMASGLNGQSFAFTGYIPVKPKERIEKIKFLEKRSEKEKQTQIFIETPYRNMKLFEELINVCKPDTLLTIAADITGKNEFILTKSIREWKNKSKEVNLNKIPAVFLLQGV